MFSNIPSNTGGLFGSATAPSTTAPSLFGTAGAQQTTPGLGGASPFGVSGGAGTGGLFGNAQQNTGLFGTTPQPTGGNTTGSIFGTTQPSGTGLFGSQQPQVSTTPSLFGTSTGATTTAASPFAQGTSSGLFGQPTSTGNAFQGATNQPTTSIFGSSAGTTSGFGTSSGGNAQITGTKNIHWREETHRDVVGKIQAITVMPEVNQTKCIDELRWEDYRLGLGPNQQSMASQPFGSTSLFPQAGSQQPSGPFGSSAVPSTTGPFGTTNTTGNFGGGLFGAQRSQPSTSNDLFSSTQSTGGNLFGSSMAQKPATSLFGSSTTTPTSTGLFGTQPASTLGGFPGTSSGGGLFGASSTPGTTLGQSSLLSSNTTATPFGSTTLNQPSTASGGSTSLFGTQPASTTTTSGGLFGSTQPGTGSLFGTPAGSGAGGTTAGTGLFGAPSRTSGIGGGSLFGSTGTGTSGTASGGLFGAPASSATAATTTAPSLFGSNSATSQQPQSTGLFGSTLGGANKPQTTSLFGAPSTAPALGSTGAPRASLFGTPAAGTAPTQPSSSLFGKTAGTGASGTSLFGTSGTSAFPAATGSTLGSTSLFGSSPAGGSLFGNLPATKSDGLGGLGSGSILGGGLTGASNSLLLGTSQQPQQQLQQPSQQFLTGASGPGVFGGAGLSAGGSAGATDAAGLSGMYPLAFPYGLSGGGFPMAVPNAFTFPSAGVILPNVYRRYKSAALAQVWRPLPEHCTNYRRQLLPSLTPKRFLRPRRSSLPISSAAGFGNSGAANLADCEWSEYGMRPALQAVAAAAAMDAGMTPPPRKGVSAARNGRSSLGNTSRYDSVFRRLASEDGDQSPLVAHHRGWAGASAYPSGHPSSGDAITGSVSTARQQRYAQQRPLWTDRSEGFSAQHAQGLEPQSKRDATISYWGAPSPGTGTLQGGDLKRDLDMDSENGYPIGPPWLGRSGADRSHRAPVPVFQLNETDPRWASRYPEELPDDLYSSRNRAAVQNVTTETTCGSLTRRTGRLGLNAMPSASNDGILTKRRWEAIAPICTREGYSTKPSMETLRSYTESRLAAVEDFTVIREGFGEITWPGLTDVRGLSIDDVVVIEDKAVEVYPETCADGSPQEYPPVGVGLNKPALVTLYNCGPKGDEDQGIEELATVSSKKKYEVHVEKMRAFTKKIGGQFISLSPQWVWKFRVEHFSRYAYTTGTEEDRHDG